MGLYHQVGRWRPITSVDQAERPVFNFKPCLVRVRDKEIKMLIHVSLHWSTDPQCCFCMLLVCYCFCITCCWSRYPLVWSRLHMNTTTSETLRYKTKSCLHLHKIVYYRSLLYCLTPHLSIHIMKCAFSFCIFITVVSKVRLKFLNFLKT